jgi:hypothetical protein
MKKNLLLLWEKKFIIIIMEKKSQLFKKHVLCFKLGCSLAGGNVDKTYYLEKLNILKKGGSLSKRLALPSSDYGDLWTRMEIYLNKSNLNKLIDQIGMLCVILLICDVKEIAFMDIFYIKCFAFLSLMKKIIIKGLNLIYVLNKFIHGFSVRNKSEISVFSAIDGLNCKGVFLLGFSLVTLLNIISNFLEIILQVVIMGNYLLDNDYISNLINKVLDIKISIKHCFENSGTEDYENNDGGNKLVVGFKVLISIIFLYGLGFYISN